MIKSSYMTIHHKKIIYYSFMMFFAMIASIVFLVEPAMAFTEFGERVNTQTEAATATATSILYIAAILALIIGVAPMLWGQVKVKWIVSSIVAAIIFGLIPTLIDGITSTAPDGIAS